MFPRNCDLHQKFLAQTPVNKHAYVKHPCMCARARACVLWKTHDEKKEGRKWKRQTRWYGISTIGTEIYTDSQSERASSRETQTPLELPRENRKWRQKRQEVATGCCVTALCYRWKNAVTEWNKKGGKKKKNNDTVKECPVIRQPWRGWNSWTDHTRAFFSGRSIMQTQQAHFCKLHTQGISIEYTISFWTCRTAQPGSALTHSNTCAMLE